MPTKTTRKTAVGKPAAAKAAKAHAVHKAAAPKAKAAKKTPEHKAARAHEPVQAKKTEALQPVAKASATSPALPPRREVERVSLIDEKKAPKKSEKDGELKKKTAVLPPISRIRASLEAPAAPAKIGKPAAPTTKVEPPKKTQAPSVISARTTEAETAEQEV